MTSNTGTTDTIAVDGSDTVNIEVGDKRRHIDRLAIEHTAGDAASYDVIVSSDPDLDGGTEDKTMRLDDTSSHDPSNDPLVLDNGGNGYTFQNEDGKIYVKITANDGTNGGNEFKIRIFM